MAEENQDTEQLRAQAATLLSQARSQAATVQRALQAVAADGVLYPELAGAANQLSGAISDLESALQSSNFNLRAADLSTIRSMVQSGAISSLVSQASTQASVQAAARTVAATAAETRNETQAVARDVFDRKIFEPYLHFSSKEDEAEYRRREAEAKRYIDAQLAKHTPEGDLNAGGGTLGQMLDANVHGAGNSPDFMPRWNALAEKVQHQRAAMHAAGQKTEEFDRNLNVAARRFLKAKGLSEAQIDAKLAGGKDPLEVVKPYLGNDQASRDLEQVANPVAATDIPHVTMAAASDKVGSAKIDTIGAGLKAAGVQMAADAPADNIDHGLSGRTGEKGRASPSLSV